ncbi:MAG TPA: hypothetical protein VFS67_29445 [Polyangiaceae bacterium]|nr:hypothetical protein [Polyangiaceae bacterium]
MLRQVGLLALVALPLLGCAKGEEIAPGEVVIFTLEPADAGPDAAAAPETSDPSAASGTGGSGGMGTTSPPPMSAGQPAGGSAGTASDASTNDAGRSEDRPVDAGN